MNKQAVATEVPWGASILNRSASNTAIWAGRIFGGLPALFLLVDGVMKLFKPAIVVDTSAQLGYPESSLVGIGLTLLVSTLLYLVPRTRVLGAVLLTGYLGGAAATHVRVGGPIFPVIFPVLLGTMLWAGLWFRDSRVRPLLPIVERSASS